MLLRNLPNIVMMDETGFLQPDNGTQESTMPNADYSTLVAQQREFFLSGGTHPVARRKSQLRRPRRCSPKVTTSALWKDLRRNAL